MQKNQIVVEFKSTKVLVQFILVAFFLNTVIPIKLQASEIKPPFTINNKVEDVRDYNQYNNKIRQVIVGQTKNDLTATNSNNLEYTNNTLNSLNTTFPKQQNNLNLITKLFQQTTLFFFGAMQGIYASQPFTANSLALLFNNSNYLRLRKEAEDRKKKKLLEEAKNNEVIKKINKAYQEELAKIEVYREITEILAQKMMTTFFITRTKAEKEVVRQQQELIRQQAIQRAQVAKQSAKKRMLNRYDLIKKIAQEVYVGILDNAKVALGKLDEKVVYAYTAWIKIKDKTRKARHKYEDRKDEVKKMKKRYKKYKKYLKKFKKYKKKYKKKHKSKYKKKYKKYENKAAHALKKYLRSKKRVAKYGGTTKMYKQGFKALEGLVDQYEKQYQTVLAERRRAKSKYSSIGSRAKTIRQTISKDAGKVYQRDLSKLEMVDYTKYQELGNYTDLDINIKKYLQNVPQISAGSALMSTESGLAIAKDITKQTAKIAKKVRKKYKKALKKQKKKEEKAKREYLKKVAEAKRQDYLRRVAIANREKIKQQAQQQYGYLTQGFSSRLGKTAYASGLVGGSVLGSSYVKPQKKSWWKKTLDWTKSKVGGIKDWLGKTSFKIGSWIESKQQSIKNISQQIKINVNKKFKDTSKFLDNSITKAIVTIKQSFTNTLKNIKTTFNYSVDSIKRAKERTFAFGGNMGVWYNEKRKEDAGKIEKKAKELFAKGLQTMQRFVVGDAIPEKAEPFAQIAEHVYEKSDGEFPVGYRILTINEELARYGLTPEMLENKKTGFKASVYLDENTEKVVVAFAGTNGFKDWLANFKQGLGFETGQYEGVRIITENMKGYVNLQKNLVFTGHSLGGGQAALAGAITGAETHTFNAAGVHKKTLIRAGASNNDLKNSIINYSNYDDILTHFQEDSYVKFLAPDALGKQIEYGSKINSIIPNFTKIGKMLKIYNGTQQHGNYKVK